LKAGNVRELENVIERAVILCKKDLIILDDVSQVVASPKEICVPSYGISLDEMVETLEKQKIEEALKKFRTQRKAATELKITERMLGYKIKKYGLG
jgi:Nif-specific regulatory protein